MCVCHTFSCGQHIVMKEWSNSDKFYITRCGLGCRCAFWGLKLFSRLFMGGEGVGIADSLVSECRNTVARSLRIPYLRSVGTPHSLALGCRNIVVKSV